MENNTKATKTYKSSEKQRAYSRTYYQENRKNNLSVCDHCKCSVLSTYLKKHQETAKCKRAIPIFVDWFYNQKRPASPPPAYREDEPILAPPFGF